MLEATGREDSGPAWNIATPLEKEDQTALVAYASIGQFPYDHPSPMNSVMQQQIFRGEGGNYRKREDSDRSSMSHCRMYVIKLHSFKLCRLMFRVCSSTGSGGQKLQLIKDM